MLAGLLRALRRAGPHLRPVVLSADPPGTARLHGVAARGRSLPGAWRALAGARLLISGGGGLLQDVTSARSSLYYLAVMAMARLRGARVVWAAHGIGPVNRRWLRRLVGREARRAAALSVRDEASRRALAAWSGLAAEGIERMPDPAWLLADAVEPALSRAGEDGDEGSARPWRVAVVWRDWTGQAVPARRAGRALGEALAAALPGGAEVAVLAFHPARDLQACRELARGLAEAPHVGPTAPAQARAAPADPVEAVRELAGFDVVVAVRLHGLILAGAAGVPFVGVAYDPKVAALLSELAWPVPPVPPGEAGDAGAWRERLQAVASQHAALRARLAEVRRAMAGQAASALEGLLARAAGSPAPAGEPRLPAPVEVVGVPVHPVSLEEAEAAAAAWLERASPRALRHVVTLNPEMVMQARRDPALAACVREADLVVPDGVGVVWAGRMLGHPMKGRVPGIELAERLLAACSRRGMPVFLVGGRPAGPEGPAVAEQAARRLAARPELAGLVVAGWHHGYFAWDSPEEASLLQALEAARPALLLVGMGSPRQERFIARHRHRLAGCGVRVAIGVGGSFDVWAGRSRRAPPLMRRLGLEWLYRVAREPWRLRRVAALPAFAVSVLAARRGGIMGQRSHRGA
ncbi:MAG TPA: WecB/TagA/CpsF family glycosyltransferase [Limnochordales bacterium]